MQLFEIWPGAVVIVAAVIGLLVGSFLNVVAYRVPRMMERAWREQCAELASAGDTAVKPADTSFNLWWPPSTCPQCGKRIAAWHNIPVVSFLLLRGRCAECGQPIARRYPVVEAFAAVLSLTVAYVFGPTWHTVAALGFTWTLLAMSLIDIDHHLLPDSMTLPLLWAGLLISLFSAGGEPLFADLRSSVIGAAAGYLSLWAVYHLFKLVTGKEGMGYGDFKLLGAIGAWLGWQMLPLVILLSAAVGAVLGSVMLLLAGKSRQTPIPFGPYLAAAGWIGMLWGNDLLAWYSGFLR